jgi:hypothetical protein
MRPDREKGPEHADQLFVFRDVDRDSQHNYRRWFYEAPAEARIKRLNFVRFVRHVLH